MSHQLKNLSQISSELNISEQWLRDQIDGFKIIAHPIPDRDGKLQLRFHLDKTANQIAEMVSKEEKEHE